MTPFDTQALILPAAGPARPEAPSVPRTFTLDTETDQALSAWSARTRVNKSATIRMALRQFFAAMGGIDAGA